MQSKIAKTWGAGCARWLGGYLLSVIIFLCLSVCVAPVLVGAVSYVVNNFDTRTALLILAPLGALAILIPLGATLVYAGWVFTQRRRQLDAAFSPLGLTGSAFNLAGRQYHGSFQGRRVDFYYTPGTGGLRAYASPSKLDLYLATPLKTSLVVATKEALTEAAASLMNRPQLQQNDADWAQRDIFALDEAWSRALLSDPAAKSAILRLTADQGTFELRQFYLRPEALHLALYRFPQSLLTPQNVQEWMGDLLATARIAESLPAPQKTEEASGLERDARTDRNRFTVLGWGIALGVMGLLTVCFAGMAGVMFWYVNQGR
jgi:hypothetical protein